MSKDNTPSASNPQEENDFISPLSDFGFKNLFGKEGKATQNLIVLLNAILHEQLGFEKIVKVTLNPTENKARNKAGKSTQYDIHCTTDHNHKIIVEMQNRWEPNFDNRLLYYVTEAIIAQGVHIFRYRPWDYTLVPVVGLAICNFTPTGFEGKPLAFFNLRELKSNIKYGDQLNLAFVHLKEFSQDIDKCISELDKIVYSLKNMESIQKTNNNPFSNEKGDFYDTIAEMSRYSSLTAEEQMEYHAWRIHENDQQLREIRSHNEGRNIGKAEGLAEGRIKGRAEGLAEGKLDQALNTARKLYDKGMNLEEIAELTDLSIEQLKASLQTK